jgi:ribosomal protein L40E
MTVFNQPETQCSQCGTLNGHDAEFCRQCGKAAVRATAGKRVMQMLMIFVNPGAILKNHLSEYPWPWALGISGLAFMLFFLQTGIDLFRVNKINTIGVAGLALAGIVYGTVGVSLLAGVAWLGCRSARTTYTYGWAIRAFGLSYSPTLVYVVLGLAANLLFGWNTSVAFGITGALWAMNPMNAAIKEMTAGRTGISIVLTSLCGGLLLFGWALISTS